jgi:redox-sensitive bicupin YhaK (pirin superfamily)
MEDQTIINIKNLGFQWDTNNPFLFCVHHLDAYPRGNNEMGPDASTGGRRLGNDFVLKDGWRMYHGRRVPGFPVHPHRGFETVTIVLEGFVDHADSMGAAGRYGMGDVQWMTAGAGMQHAEMFPLLNRDRENPLELFQIWLNLPAVNKFVKPYYKMLWSEDIPRFSAVDEDIFRTEVTLIAGSIGDLHAPRPNPDSWAAAKENEVAIWLIRMAAGARWEIPPASREAKRSLYFHRGPAIQVGGRDIHSPKAIDLRADRPVLLENGPDESHMLLLQGRPINEPSVQYGPFVMNTEAEIRQAFADYRKTEFGGWPWPHPDQVHGPSKRRFAKYPDGTEEVKD